MSDGGFAGNSKSMFKFDKEKYLQILRSAGANAALTALQKDTERWEFQSFEGEQGYQPEMNRGLSDVRAFSRELWEIATLKT